MTRRIRELSYTKAYRLDDPHVVAGRKMYLIGSQDGRFPDLGDHVPQEMGGLWSHPIKVLDGFWLGLKGLRPKEGRSGDSADDLAAVTWLPPAERFETSPVSARYVYPSIAGLEISCERWIPHDEESLVVTYDFRQMPGPGTGATRTGGATLPVVLLFRTDLQGVWLSERLGWQDGLDQAAILDEAGSERGLVHAWDDKMPFHAVIGPSQGTRVARCQIGHELWGPEITHGQGISIAYSIDLPVDDLGRASLTFVVSSSSESKEQALATWTRVSERIAELRAEKERAMEELLSLSRLDVDDAEIRSLFDDIKVGYEQLYRQVDSCGTGLGAGLPEYPWWFGCDNSYALLGALCVGRFDMALNTLRLLAKVSQETNGDGRIIHEVSTNGVVYNPGNTQETPHFVMAVWESFLWTGDESFLRELYPLCRKGVLEWCLKAQDSDGDLFPEGYGITEVAGLNWELIDTAVYTHGALVALAEMATVLEDQETATEAAELAARLAEAIEERYWLEEQGLYADLIAPPKVVLERLEQIRSQENYQSAAMRSLLDEIEDRCRRSDPEAEQPWLFKTWVIFCPLETGLASEERALRALRRLESSEFTGRFGVYLSGYSQTHAMTISTGVAAVAEARYRRMEASLSYIRLIAATRSLRFPGAPSEMSPDYGCFVQAWTGYGVAAPIVRHFFGLSPAAHQRRIKLAPCLPTSWERARLDNVRIGDQRIDLAIAIDKDRGEVKLEVNGPGSDWTIEVEMDPRWYGLSPGDYTLSLNGEAHVEIRPGQPSPVAFEWRSRGRNLVVLSSSGTGS